jgi:hypothetical protein
MSSNAADAIDFRNARMRGFLRSVVAQLSGKSTKMLPWDEVRDKLGLRGLIRRGVASVPVDKIVGSVGRYLDFDNAFLPVSNSVQSRWRKINRAFYDDVSLPPVTLYKVGDAYFVLDGNHRVSVAREHEVAYIDAEVFEATTPVSITIDDLVDADHLNVLGEYARFLDRTRLNALRPDQQMRFTIGGAYERIIEHIAVHRYFMGLDLKRDISEDEAVTDWYDTVYMPIIQAVREDKILKDFPNRTESDLYLWIIDHQHFLRAHGDAVDADEAATDYADKYGEKSPLERVQMVISQIMGD